ncbi:pirin family protein [Francisella frigiditurris]|uniref:Pirin family protein n=1 Tax=Francisella frigiditurris TaxID=1542390 RepID=A0A1J0KT35_9GAMM|nr:pirin family protein [Francisella frigiditurris]APC96859.1 pirin family protein [Francisella frigiditurris]
MLKDILKPRKKNIGNLPINRLLPSAKQKMVGPWIFFDHFGPIELSENKGLDILPHPHINLATVTYLFDGEIIHRDSIGSFQTIKPGDLNLMLAGKGIVHSEREPENIRKNKRLIHGLQFWLALPSEVEETEPAFFHYSKENLPTFEVNDTQIKLIIGTAWNKSSPVKTYCDTLFAKINILKGNSLTLPNKEEIGIYVLSGEITVGQEKITQYALGIPDKESTHILANTNSEFIILGGVSLGRRFIEWNFVSSHADRISQAKEDWLAQRFDKVVDDENEFIPLPHKFTI